MVLNLIDAAADLFLGATCPGCARPGAGLCGACSDILQDTDARLVSRTMDDFPAAFAAHDYGEVIAKLIVSYKEKQAWWLDRHLANALKPLIATLPLGSGTVLVPMPSRESAIRARGEDVVLRLAKRIRKPGLAVVPMLRQLATQDQAGLSASERQQNLNPGMAVQKRRPTRCVLVDDIVTTGATLAAATKSLTAAGHEVVCAVAVAEARLARKGKT